MHSGNIVELVTEYGLSCFSHTAVVGVASAWLHAHRQEPMDLIGVSPRYYCRVHLQSCRFFMVQQQYVFQHYTQGRHRVSKASACADSCGRDEHDGRLQPLVTSTFDTAQPVITITSVARSVAESVSLFRRLLTAVIFSTNAGGAVYVSATFASS